MRGKSKKENELFVGDKVEVVETGLKGKVIDRQEISDSLPEIVYSVRLENGETRNYIRNQLKDA